MPSQRACVAESQVRNKLSNGPLRVQSNVQSTEYSATCRHTLVARGMLVSCKSTGDREFKVAPRIKNYSSLTDNHILSRAFLLFGRQRKGRKKLCNLTE